MNKCVERILYLINKKGCKNTDLTTYLGIQPTAVSEWKSGKMHSYQKFIVEIADFFEVSTDYILGRTSFPQPVKWETLIQQYQLCESDKQELVDRLLGITHKSENGEIISVSLQDEEDFSMILELLSMFDSLNLVGKSRVISAAADEFEKIKTTSN